jgi:hypothetical protein
MTASYTRSEVMHFYDLTEEQQIKMLDLYHDEEEDAAEDSYVVLNDQALPLSMFMRTKGIWSGIYSVSAFSGYFIKISQCGSMATVAYKHF